MFKELFEVKNPYQPIIDAGISKEADLTNNMKHMLITVAKKDENQMDLIVGDDDTLDRMLLNKIDRKNTVDYVFKEK